MVEDIRVEENPISVRLSKKNLVITKQIRDNLIEMNGKQDTLAEILKTTRNKETKKEKKEKTNQPPPPPTEPPQKEEMINPLKKVFEKTFGTFKDIINPVNILNNVGLLSSSPIFMMMGDKLDSLIAQYQDMKTDNEKEVKKQDVIQKEQTQNNFLTEDIEQQKLEQQEQQTKLLGDINKGIKTLPLKEKESAGKGILSKLLGGFGKFLPKGVGKMLGGLGSGLFGGLLKGGGKGLGGLLKGGGKLLGKAALPLALAFGAIDFTKGFKNAKEITGGKDDLRAKVEAGLSEAISGITFGLIDSKTIYKGVNWLTEKLKEIFLAPFDILKRLWKGDITFTDALSEWYSKLTFGFISKETMKKGITWLVDKLVTLFKSPFVVIQELWKGEKPITEILSEHLSKLTLGLISKETMMKAVNGTISYVKEKGLEFFNYMKENLNILFGDIWQYVVDLWQNFSFSDLMDKIIPDTLVQSIKDKIQIVQDKIKERIDMVIGFIKAPFEMVQNLFENVKNILGGEEGLINKTKEGIGKTWDKTKSFFEKSPEVKVPIMDNKQANNLVEKYNLLPSYNPEGAVTPKYASQYDWMPKQTLSPALEKVQQENMRQIEEKRRREEEIQRRKQQEERANNVTQNNQQNNNFIVQEDMSVTTRSNLMEGLY